MARNAPGKHYRQGVSLVQLTRMFPDDDAAEQWFVDNHWPDGPVCPECGSVNVQERPTRKPQPYRCRNCRKDFSVKTGTLMHGSNLGLQTWLIALYLLSTSLKGVSSMKLHRDLGVTQKTAWHLARRIREAWEDDEEEPFSGSVEVDETYVVGKRKNMHRSRRREFAGRGGAGKPVVMGARDREAGKVRARRVERTDAETLQGFAT